MKTTAYALLTFVALGSICSAQTQLAACGDQLSSASTYEGVAAFSNGDDQRTLKYCNGTGTYGPQYLDTEYVKRFYGQALLANSTHWSGYPYTYFTSAASKGLYAFPNGGNASPAIEDIVVYDGRIGGVEVGHVAVVTAVNPNSVKLVEQNDSDTGVATNLLTISSGGSNNVYTLANRQNFTVTGWLRSMNDAFQDNVLNLRRWVVLQPPPGFIGNVNEANQQLQISDVSGAGGTGLETLCTLSGDFDVSVDFYLTTWPINNNHGVRILARELNASINRSSGGGEFYAWTPGGQGSNTSDLSGSLRITRTGGNASGYYLQNGNWVLLGTSPVSTQPTHFDIDLGTNFEGTPTTIAAYDNFKVTKGVIGCPAVIP